MSNVNKLRNDLSREYRDHILDPTWEAVYGGGLLLRANFLHASLTEFIVAFHAAHRTQGFSGTIFVISFYLTVASFGRLKRSPYGQFHKS